MFCFCTLLRKANFKNGFFGISDFIAVMETEESKFDCILKVQISQEMTPPQDPQATGERRSSRRLASKTTKDLALNNKLPPKCLKCDCVDSNRKIVKRRREPKDEQKIKTKLNGAKLHYDQPAALSEYELERLENIRQNQAFLCSLQLPQVAEALKQRQKPQRGLREKVKAVGEVLPARKSLRLQGKDAEPPHSSEPAAKTEKIVVRKPEGPIPMVPVNLEGGALPEDLLKLWNEDSVTVEQEKLDVERYQSVLQQMSLGGDSVVKVLRQRVFSAAFHPCTSSLLMAAGDKEGCVGLWSLDSNRGENGVLLFEPHSRPVTCMAFSPSRPSALISVSYDGTVRCTDVERAVFEEVYRSEASLKSFDFLSPDCSTMLIGQWEGDVAIVDRRTPGTSYESLHSMDPKNLHSVHVHPVQKQYFVVAESSTVHVYDVRCLKESASRPVCSLLGHSKSISSAYFSPRTGHRVLTTCMDDNIRVYDTSEMVSTPPLLSSISHNMHNMHTGHWLSKLSAVWDPKQDDCFVIGSLDRPRRVQVFHESGRLLHSFRDEEHLSTVCSITAFHPSRNALLGCNACGRLHVFTDQH